MAKVKIDLDLFSDWKPVGEDGEYVPGNGTIEQAVITEAARQLLETQIPADGEKDAGVAYMRGEKLRELLTEKMDEAVNARIEAMTFEALDGEVRNVIAKGWQKTDEFGNPSGPITLSGLVIKILNTKEGDYGRSTRIEKWVQEAIEKALREVFAKEIESARIAFKAQLDGVLMAKLREALAASLGLKA